MVKVINPFTDIDYLPPEMKTSPTAFQSAKTLQIGYGADVMRVNRQGIWLGRETFEEARDATTFAVSMDGTMYIQQIQAGIVTIAGSTTLADWRHPSDQTTINGGDIYTGSVTASKITVSQLSALSANMGTITAGTYQTAGSSERIKIQDDNIKWEYYSGGWKYCGVLEGDYVSTYQQYEVGGISMLSSYGIKHTGSDGSFAVMGFEYLAAEKIWASDHIHSPEVCGYKVYSRNGLNFQQHYYPQGGTNIGISYNSTTSVATISLQISGSLNMGGNDITNIDDCYATKFWGNGSGGVTGSHSWVNAEGDTVDIQVKGGIVTNFTVT